MTLKAWHALRDELPFFIVADPGHFPDDAPVVLIECPSLAKQNMPSGLPVLLHSFPQDAEPGTPSPENARAVIEVIERGVRLVQSGAASALTTAPIAKKVLVDFADFKYPGHTEFLAALTGAPTPVMMIASEALKVVPVTIHMPLSE
ncbi:MAG: 4-hydroxythreonine-4-phosphate dehydrogenase PdxA, partial [Pseudomonadota bacterium]